VFGQHEERSEALSKIAAAKSAEEIFQRHQIVSVVQL
jgi:hypothetical protein